MAHPDPESLQFPATRSRRTATARRVLFSGALLVGAAVVLALLFGPGRTVGPTPPPARFVGWYALAENTDGSGALRSLDLLSSALPAGQLRIFSVPLSRPVPIEARRDLEPFVTAVDGNNVAIGYFDGTSSRLIRVDLANGATADLTIPGLVHHALLAGSTVYFVRIDPVTHRNTGVWEATPTGASQLFDPPPNARGVGFGERLSRSADGAILLSRYCESECLLREFNLGTRTLGATAAIPNGDHAGTGFTSAAFGDPCASPCGWRVVDLRTLAESSLGRQDGPAVLLGLPGGDVLAYTAHDGHEGVMSAVVNGGPATGIDVKISAGFAVAPLTDHQGYQLPAGRILVARDGLLPMSRDSLDTTAIQILDVLTGRLAAVTIASAPP